MHDNDIIIILKEVRLEKGIKVRALAKLSGVHRSIANHSGSVGSIKSIL